jgi:hypothetical protein
MRHFTLVVATLICGIGLPAWAADADSEVLITGRLVALERQPHCGVFSVGSPATYKVITGPVELVGMKIKALVYCIELPRGDSSSTYGDLEVYEIGATHFLALTKRNVYSIEMPNPLPPGNEWFYMRAASLKPLPPNKSLERSREG